MTIQPNNYARKHYPIEETMNYLQAIKLLAPYHDAKLIWVVPDTNPPTGQLTTGLQDNPIISVDSGVVCADELYDVLDQHAHNPTQPAPLPAPVLTHNPNYNPHYNPHNYPAYSF